MAKQYSKIVLSITVSAVGIISLLLGYMSADRMRIRLAYYRYLGVQNMLPCLCGRVVL
jgi:hypothetical protein